MVEKYKCSYCGQFTTKKSGGLIAKWLEYGSVLYEALCKKCRPKHEKKFREMMKYELIES